MESDLNLGRDIPVNPRSAEYKCRNWRNNQESRRIFLLEEQKRKREDCFDAFRDFSNVFTVNDEEGNIHEEDWMDFSAEEIKEEKAETPKFFKLKNLFMLSEWMTQVPMDFQDKWIFVPCPIGKRCLVKSTKGLTTVCGKRGNQLAKFRSALPNGGSYDSFATKYSKSYMTILDCIWSSALQKYFILDVLYWKDQSCLCTDVSFRNFWIKSKIVEEMPWISEKSKKNPFPFVPLRSYPCDSMTISSVMSNYPYFDLDEPKVDGILFYHQEGYYTPGLTPLVLWLKPYMLLEMLGQEVCVADEYFKIRPSDYTDMYSFIAKYENTQREKLKKRKHNKCLQAVEVMDATDGVMDVCVVDGDNENEFKDLT